MNNNYQSPMGGQSQMGNQGSMGGMNPNQGPMNQPFGQSMMNQTQSAPQQPMGGMNSNIGPMNQQFGGSVQSQSMMNQQPMNQPFGGPTQPQPTMNQQPMGGMNPNQGPMNQPFGQPNMYNQPPMGNQSMMFPEQKKKSKVGLVIGIVVIFFVVCAVIGYFVGGPTPNYGVGDLKLYIPTDWSREDDTTYYNSDRTCRLIAGSNENYSIIEEKVSGVISTNAGFTRSTKNINGKTWNYSNYASNGEMMHIYWIEYKGTGYMVAIAGKDSGDCLEYKEDLEKSIKLK